jgi:hypothetical protein
MPAMFSSPPKPAATPIPKPVKNTSLDANAAAAGRRQGLQAAILAGSGGRTGTALTHTMTGQ